MKKKTETINFSKKYSKFKNKEGFTTVRWIDSQYILGNIYQVVFVDSSKFHVHREQGKARLISMKIMKMNDLTDKFITEDADCSREEFFKMMYGWYGKKADWNHWLSEIQILVFEWV